jgi:hypothetical protein
MDDAVRCQCLQGSGDDHAVFYPPGVIDEVQLITLDSIAPETIEAAMLGQALDLADDRRIAMLMKSGSTRVAALGGLPRLGRATKETKATKGAVRRGEGKPVATSSTGNEKHSTESAHLSTETSAVGLKKDGESDVVVRRLGGASPTKAAAATAILGVAVAMGVAATRLHRSRMRQGSEEAVPLISGQKRERV